MALPAEYVCHNVPRAPALEAAPNTIRADVSVRPTTCVQLACWKRQDKDGAVENSGEYELKGVLDRWQSNRLVG